MTVICAWCQREGRPAVLRIEEPRDLPLETHGICAAHSVQVLAQLRVHLQRKWRTPEPRDAADGRHATPGV